MGGAGWMGRPIRRHWVPRPIGQIWLGLAWLDAPLDRHPSGESARHLIGGPMYRAVRGARRNLFSSHLSASCLRVSLQCTVGLQLIAPTPRDSQRTVFARSGHVWPLTGRAGFVGVFLVPASGRSRLHRMRVVRWV
eukprot:7489379-Pyramimonas_sp.AAC.1